MKKMTTKRAIEILDPDTEPVWKGGADADLETVKEACRVAVKALRIINPQIGKKSVYEITNADMMISTLAKIVDGGADDEGYPVDYDNAEELAPYIECPYTHQPLCALADRNKGNPEAYADCCDCKAHWLMKKWED